MPDNRPAPPGTIMALNRKTEVETGSARAPRAVFRALAENLERTGEFRTFGAASGAKELGARLSSRTRGACAPQLRFSSSRFLRLSDSRGVASLMIDSVAINTPILSVSFLCGRKDRFPIVLHAHDGPAFGFRLIKPLVQFPDVRLAVVGPFAVSIGVMNVKTKARATAG